MDEFEKVEKLVARANVSYEDARNALRASNGDLLDAMVYLEKQGKTARPEQSIYTTNYSEQPRYENVPETINKNMGEKPKEGFFAKVGNILKKVFHTLSVNELVVAKDDATLIDIPLWVAILAFIAAWHILLVIVIVSLFFNVRYKVVGEDDKKASVAAVNNVMSKGTDFAEQIKTDFQGNSQPYNTPNANGANVAPNTNVTPNTAANVNTVQNANVTSNTSNTVDGTVVE